jgi:quercetin dioxygenase-like cupin family protein
MVRRLIVGGAAHGRTRRLVMTSYYEPDSRVWSPVNVRGTAMEKSPVFEGHGTQSALFRMASGCQIPDHHHSNWVQAAVLSGRMRVEQDASPARVIPAGGVYFVSPGEDHVEIAEVETVVLVTQPLS